MIGLSLILVLVAVLAYIEAGRRADREELRQRLGRTVKSPQLIKSHERPVELPEFCQICPRPMSLPAGTAQMITPAGEETIYCCSYCLALGGLDSMLSAAAEQAASPDRTDLAQPCGAYPAPRAISDLPGGASPAAGTF